MDTNNTLYYTKLPWDTKPYLAQGIVPVLRSKLDRKSFKSLDEVVYLKGRYSIAPTLCTFMIDVKNMVDHVGANDEVLGDITEGGLGDLAIQVAGLLIKYIKRNEGKLKVVTLYDGKGVDMKEEKILQEAVEIVNHDSHNPVRLEKIV